MAFTYGQPSVGQAPPGMKWDATRGGYVPATPTKMGPDGIKRPVLPQATTNATPSAQPTFQLPATGIEPTRAIASQPDPRISALTQQLSHAVTTPPPAPASDPRMNALIEQLDAQIRTAQSGRASLDAKLAELSAPITVTAPDFTRQREQAAKTQALIEQLQRGEGITVAPMGTDPEAIAFRNAQERGVERARMSAANRQGASGTSGSGAFDAEIAKIRERAGETAARFEADLTGRRRGELTRDALAAANLSLANMDRETRDEMARYESEVAREAARRSGIVSEATLRASSAAADDQRLLRLIEVLAAQEASARLFDEGQRQFNRTSEMALLDQLFNEQSRVQSIPVPVVSTARGPKSEEARRNAKLSRLYAGGGA